MAISCWVCFSSNGLEKYLKHVTQLKHWMFINDWRYLIWSERRKHLKHVTSLNIDWEYWLCLNWDGHRGSRNHFLVLNTNTRWQGAGGEKQKQTNKQNYWVCLTQEWMKKQLTLCHSSETRWLSMVSILMSVGPRKHLILSKPWNTGGWWLCMPQCGQTTFQIMSHHWNAGMVINTVLI